MLIPALIIYVVFKDRGQLVRQESKEALNWTINVAGVLVAIWILEAIFTFVPLVGWIINFLLLLVLWAVLIVNVISRHHRRRQGGEWRQLPLPGEHPLDQVVRCAHFVALMGRCQNPLRLKTRTRPRSR